VDNHDRNTVMHIIYNESFEVDLPPQDIDTLNALPVDNVVCVLRDIFDEEGDLTVVKSRAYRAILGMRDFDKVQFLLDMFERSSTDWQIAYCRDLARFSDSRAIAKLCVILLEESEPDIRYAAAESLAEVGDSTTLEALKYAQQHDIGTDYEGFRVADMASEALQKIQSRISKQ
jgi:HEAT repeat protein